jgi:hypothetical protein
MDLFAAPIVFRALFHHAEMGPDFAELVTHAVLAGAGSAHTPPCTHAVGPPSA